MRAISNSKESYILDVDSVVGKYGAVDIRVIFKEKRVFLLCVRRRG